MLLPIIKLAARNWISYCLGNNYDLIPQVLIFNVDVFNAFEYMYVVVRSSSKHMLRKHTSATDTCWEASSEVRRIQPQKDLRQWVRGAILCRRGAEGTHERLTAAERTDG
ncbi:hypothetical protein PF005_g13108 [Phytophthora fragariae]|uniref:Uncharacterized protein n=1 Tax=Phytophthora fragariae TaxID=53985 RepID=A0A6A3Y005_9STRA|nr:hypothetical protein PF009_g13848 [Phytophthora fragariae]KAE8998647.1 hypothetical protein PF011_g14967 [Phytophthora fragariae]KAE9105431.1 hypothetical protein PF007_g13715 [Phytophthora fragariae]KAE9133919.1 hypothetical protein PF006_g14929 [Phytophthora fragariae]KAE9206181.1 hypothetical protein PF005_g13108 [Phytophthora fragariae]